MGLVPNLCLAADYTARPNVSLQTNTKREHHHLYLSDVMICEPKMSTPYILWFGLNVLIAHYNAGHRLLENSDFFICHHNPHGITPL